MKILHVLNHFLPYQIAGTEVYVWALAKHLNQYGCQSKVVTPNYGKTVDETYIYDDLEVIRYAEPTIQDRALIMGRKLPAGLESFKRILDKERPNIVHFHEYSTGNGIVQEHIQAAKKTAAKVIMTFHLAGYTCRTGTLMYKSETLCDGRIEIYKCSRCYLNYRGFEKLRPILMPLSSAAEYLKLNPAVWDSRIGTALATTQLLRKFQADFRNLTEQLDSLVTLTHWYKDVLLRNSIPASKISHIPQGLPVNNCSKQIVSIGNAFSVIRLVFIGRISAFKGLHLLIEAIMELPQDEITLDIYGQPADEVYEQELRNKSRKLVNVLWKGKLSQQEVVPTLRQYDLLCLCSTFSEMSPLVIQEAFAAGIPVLASNVYGNAEQIRHNENGLLFTFNSIISLREQLKRCIDDATLLDRLKNYIPSVRSFKDVAGDYYFLYNRLCSK